MIKYLDYFINIPEEDLNPTLRYHNRMRLCTTIFLALIVLATVIAKGIQIHTLGAADLVTFAVSFIFLLSGVAFPVKEQQHIYRFLLIVSFFVIIPFYTIEAKSNSWVFILWSICLFHAVKVEMGFKIAMPGLLVSMTSIAYAIYAYPEFSPIIKDDLARVCLSFIPPVLLFTMMQMLNCQFEKEVKEHLGS